MPTIDDLFKLFTLLLVFGTLTLGLSLFGYWAWLWLRNRYGPSASSQEMETRLQALHDRLARSEKEREALRERLENLETIAANEAWSLQPKALTEDSSVDAVEEDTLDLPSDKETESSPEKRTADLARKLQGK